MNVSTPPCLFALAAAVLALQGLSAYEVTIGPVTYEVGATTVTVDDCASNVTGTIVIPATVDGKPVTVVGQSAFEGCETLAGIDLPDGITELENYAFLECYALSSVTIPDSVTRIGYETFSECDLLTSLTLPASLVELGDYVFAYCDGLASIHFPANLATIGEHSFDDCTSLTSFTVDSANTSFAAVGGVLFSKDLKTLIRFPPAKAGPYAIPAGTEALRDSSFEDSINLGSVTFPDELLTIGNSVFTSTPNLGDLVLSDNVTSIGHSVFSSCPGLTSVTFGSGVSSIGISLFLGSRDFQDIYVAGGNATFADIDGVLFSKDLSTLLLYPYGRTRSWNCCFNMARIRMPRSKIPPCRRCCWWPSRRIMPTPCSTRI